MDASPQEAKTDAFAGFGFAIRTFWISAKDLKVGRGWYRERLSNDGAPKFSSGIYGTAVSEKDGVCVIGKDFVQREFDITISVDTDAKADWERHKANDISDLHINDKTPGEIIRIMKLINERLDADPPTSTLFTYEDDWEIGIKAGWSIECLVPPDVFSKIQEELHAGLITSLRIGIHWEAGLVLDKHAPPSFPTNWGMFRLGEDKSPEPLRGHLTSISWSPENPTDDNEKVNSGDLRDALSVDDDARQSPAPIVAPVIFNVPKSAIVALWVLAMAAIVHLFK